MLAICSATKVSLARTLSVEKILRKMGTSENDVYPKMMFIRISEIFYFSQNNDLPQTQSCIFHFLRGKDTHIWPGKDVNLLRGLDDSP